MMMAHDSGTPPGEQLAPETLESLRAALGSYLRSQEGHPELRHVLRAVATEAREKGILPEHLLVALKQLWAGLPEVRGIRDRGDHARALQRVVTICIGEYYR